MGVGSLFLTALIIGFSGAMMPGPLLTATINESYRRGTIAGPRLMLGHSILELGLVIGLLMGLGDFLLLPTIKISIAIIGGFFLLWMGYGIVRDSLLHRVKLELAATGSTRTLAPEAVGAFTSLSNPYWSLWWATVGLSYITIAAEKGTIGLTSFFLGHISADFIWYTLIAFAVTSGKRFLSDNVYRGILMVCGLFLIGLAFYFFVQVISF